MSIKKASLIIGFTVTLLAGSLAQQPRFDHFDISNQLSQNNITHLCVDDIGYVWIATLEGLNRFDGYQTLKFDNRSDRKGSFKGNQIYALTKGKDGNVWIVSNDGLFRYDAELERFKTFDYPIYQTKIIKEDTNGLLWLSNGDDLRWFNPFTDQSGQVTIDSSIESIIQYDSGLVISGDKGVRLVSLKDSVFEISTIYNEQVFKLSQSSTGTLYGINGKGILAWVDTNTSPDTVLDFERTSMPSITKENINAFIVKDNEIWIGGIYPLINIDLESKNIQVFTYDKNNPFSFKGYIVRNLELDKNSNLWIGTSKHGLNLLEKRKNQFSYYNWGREDRNQDIDPVRSILKTKSGDLWYAVDRFGIGLHSKDGSHKFYDSFSDCTGTTYDLKRVRSIFEDSEGNVWMGALDGLVQYNPSKDKIELAECQNGWRWPYHAYTIKEFKKGIVTISGKPNFIATVDLSQDKLEQHVLDGDNIGIIRDIIIDNENNYWSALSNGLVKFDFQKNIQRTFNSENSNLSNNKVYDLLLQNDSIWIGTNSGLNVFDIEKNAIVNTFYESDGLVNDIVYSVQEDQSHRIWLSTNNGLSLFEPHNLTFTNFLEQDHFLDDAYFQGSDGNIFFGGYEGITSFYPTAIESRNYQPKAVIEKFYLFNELIKPLDQSEDDMILDKSVSKTKAISLHHTENSFSFDLNAFPFNYPNNNKFRYRLIGQNSEWVYPIRSNRLASFSGLNPQEYTLQVQVNQGKEEWSESTELAINIIPAFWQRSWFKYLLYLLLFASVYIAYRLRIMNIRNRNKLLNKQVKEQTSKLVEKNEQILEQKNEIEIIAKKLHEADQAKLRFFTNISHEFRTPLTLILGQLEYLHGNMAHRAAKSIKNNALRLHRLVEQLIDLRKLDRDQMKLSVSHLDVISFTLEIVESFKFAAKEKEIEIHFTSSHTPLMLWFDPDKMDKILYNLISNAIKYTEKGKNIFISISKKEKGVEIAVRDEGIGIDPEHLTRIFERYYRENQSHHEGHGLGLALVKSFIDIQHADIHVSSEKGQGTEFVLTYRIGNSHFSSNDIEAPTRQRPFHKEHESLQATEEWEPYNAGKSILVVEDNHELNQFVKRVLSAYYKVDTAANGLEALEAIQIDPPELIISDIMMPKMDGLTFCKKLKENSQTSDIPVILLTAKNDTPTQIQAYELGIDGYIEKPFSTQLLLLRVSTVLSNRAKHRQFILEREPETGNPNELPQIDKVFWKQITALIDDNLSNSSLSIEDMSSEMNMSRASFYRKFKNISGISPGDHLRKVKLNRAKLLLLDSDLAIAQVSEAVGFQSISHFRRSFKQEFGTTPSELRTTNNEPIEIKESD